MEFMDDERGPTQRAEAVITIDRNGRRMAFVADGDSDFFYRCF
jgi:hypothetical protein